MPIETDITYSVGTVSIAANTTVATFVGALLAELPNARQWDVIVIDPANNSVAVPITSVTDNSHLTVPSWKLGTKVNVPYVIYHYSPFRHSGGQVMADVDDMLTKLNTDGWYRYVSSQYSDPTAQGLTANDGQSALKATTGELWTMLGGVWVFQGTYGLISVDPNVWSSVTTYPIKRVVPFAGKLWYSLQANNLNHQPDINPTWWSLFLTGGDTVYIAVDDSDRPANGETILQFVSPKPMTFYAGLADSYGHAVVAPAASAVYSIRKNGVQFATATFAIGANVATFVCASNSVFAAGDILTIVAPSPRDTTLATVALTLTAQR
jgi:hypothetical protein